MRARGFLVGGVQDARHWGFLGSTEYVRGGRRERDRPARRSQQEHRQLHAGSLQYRYGVSPECRRRHAEPLGVRPDHRGASGSRRCFDCSAARLIASSHHADAGDVDRGRGEELRDGSGPKQCVRRHRAVRRRVGLSLGRLPDDPPTVDHGRGRTRQAVVDAVMAQDLHPLGGRPVPHGAGPIAIRTMAE